MTLILTQPEHTEIKQVPCYDVNHNRILNQTCEVTIEGLPNEYKLFLLVLVLVMSVVMNPFFWRIIE